MDTQRFLLFLFAQARREDGAMPLDEVVKLGELLGKSPSSIRGCVNRLARRRLLSRVASGRKSTRYALSPAGKTLAAGIIQKFARIHSMIEQQDAWDGFWTLVSFDIAERVRERRDRFRAGLKEIGFGQLSAGLWIAPRDRTRDVQALATSLHVGTKIIISLSKDIQRGKAPVSRYAPNIWPLAHLNAKYARMKKKMQSRLMRIRTAQQSGGPIDARQVFLELFAVFNEAAELISQDPCLPEELLPDAWLGLEVQDLIHEYFHLTHGLELSDPYAYLLELPHGLHIPQPRYREGNSKP